MTYAVQADIENEFKRVSFDDPNDAISNVALSDFLDQADSVINMYIEKRYLLPIVSSNALLVLKKIAIDIVAYRVTKILSLTKSVPIPDGRVVQEITEGTAYRESMNLLKGIGSNDFDLPGEDLKNPASGLSSFHVDNPNIAPIFQKGVDQW